MHTRRLQERTGVKGEKGKVGGNFFAKVGADGVERLTAAAVCERLDLELRQLVLVMKGEPLGDLPFALHHVRKRLAVLRWRRAVAVG